MFSTKFNDDISTHLTLIAINFLFRHLHVLRNGFSHSTSTKHCGGVNKKAASRISLFSNEDEEDTETSMNHL
jgi:hypothetical protein